MKRSTQIALTAFLVLFFSVQFHLTVFGGFFWPFASHRLFSQLPLMKKPIVQAIVEDTDGNICVVHPGKVIPIEYSRCSGLVRNMYSNGTDLQKSLLVDYLLKRINERPWWAFDEIFSSVKSTTGASFTNLRFETHTVEFIELEYPHSIQINERMTLFP